MMENYRPIKVLGEGTFGRVYLARRKSTQELVCVKAVEFRGVDPRERTFCHNEVAVMKRIAHPNIVGYINSHMHKQRVFIMMEYCDGGDLRRRLDQAKGELLPESKILAWFVQIALGLHHMHTLRILHRDVKTENVFLLSSGRVVLGDLGISKRLEGARDKARTFIGTPLNMAPEMYEDKFYDEKSDIWALGCLLYELLALKSAFTSRSKEELAFKIATGRFPPIDADYSTNVRSLVGKMLAIKPWRRPTTQKILRKRFMQSKVKEFVHDLKTDTLHCQIQEKAMGSLYDQLRLLRMAHFMSLDDVIAEKDGRGSDGDEDPRANASLRRPSLKALARFSLKRFSTAYSSSFKPQQHQLEVDEETCIASEMALNRLHQKGAEPRHRPSARRSSSPPGKRRATTSSGPPKIRGSPRPPKGKTQDMTLPPPPNPRRPNLLQRLGKLVRNPLRNSSSTKRCQNGVGSLGPTNSASMRRTPRGATTSSKGDQLRVPMKGMSAVASWASGRRRDPDEIHLTRSNAVETAPTRPSRRFFSRPKKVLAIFNPFASRRASAVKSFPETFSRTGPVSPADGQGQGIDHGMDSKRICGKKEEMRQMLREAEERCRVLRKDLEKTRVSSPPVTRPPLLLYHKSSSSKPVRPMALRGISLSRFRAKCSRQVSKLGEEKRSASCMDHSRRLQEPSLPTCKREPHAEESISTSEMQRRSRRGSDQTGDLRTRKLAREGSEGFGGRDSE